MVKNTQGKQYYSQRNNPDSKITLDVLKQIFLDYYWELDTRGYLDEWLGQEDNWGSRYGGIVSNPEAYVLRKLRKKLWPIHEHINEYSEEDLLTMLEFLHDHISVPSTKAQGGYDTELAQKIYREEVGPILVDFSAGFELNTEGEVVFVEPVGMDRLLTANIPAPASVDKELIRTVDGCISKFRSRRSSLDDRKSVLIELAGVFEALKKNQQLSSVLNAKDEASVFEFANKFAVRHRDSKQINNYDKDIWLSWAFYYYLATIHAVLRLIERQEMLEPGADDRWSQVLEEMRRRYNTVYSILRMADVRFDKSHVTLGFQFAFHSKRISQQATLEKIEQVMNEVYGRKFAIEVVLHKPKTA